MFVVIFVLLNLNNNWGFELSALCVCVCVFSMSSGWEQKRQHVEAEVTSGHLRIPI